MKTGKQRILTTHTGSLPRSKEVTNHIFMRENSPDQKKVSDRELIQNAVMEIVKRQILSGLDIISDGEINKISYATYIKDLLTGFEGDSPRIAPADLADFPGFLNRQVKSGGTPDYKRPCCTGPIRIKSMDPLNENLENFSSALNKLDAITEEKIEDAFITSASPGVIALFHPNQYYKSQDDYLEALGDHMRFEYEAIISAGYVLQIDSPDLGLGRHMIFKDKSDVDYEKLAMKHVEVLNHALRNIPSERIRLHVCWGNYEGPHHYDAPMSTVLPLALKSKAQAILFEHANPRHAHEWAEIAQMKISDDKILIPGMIDTTTNFIEHPELIAQRLERFTKMIGKERIIAGTDCGFSSFAGFGSVDQDIVYAKLAALVEGTKIASKRVWN